MTILYAASSIILVLVIIAVAIALLIAAPPTIMKFTEDKN